VLTACHTNTLLAATNPTNQAEGSSPFSIEQYSKRSIEVNLTRKKLGVVAALSVTIFMMAAVVFSQDPPPRPDGPPGPRGPFGHGPQGPGPRRDFGFHGLNLTDAQKEQIRQIHESFADQTKALREQMRTLHENQRDSMTGTFDEAAVRAAAEARAKLHVEQEVLHAKIMSQVANVLTAEQRAQMAERHKHRRHLAPPAPPAPPGEPEF
jgi:Spy/CpxP family protein refolding chaperone